MESRLTIYLKFVIKGYKEAGYNRKDVASFGGLMKLQGYLHGLAAMELMEEDDIEYQAAREKVSKFVEDWAKKDPNNQYDYSKH